MWIRGHLRSLEMSPFDRSRTSFYSSSIVTMAVSCTAVEIKRDDKRQFLSRVSTLTPDIDIAIMSVRPSVRNVPVSDENGLTYRRSFFTIR